MTEFMFATGIENSYPTIAGRSRVDEMEKCGHYRLWRQDLELVARFGLSHLRWGPPLYQVFQAPGRYDWSWTDAVVREMRRLSIEPVLDLCHFGVPDWLGNFQNTDFPRYFAEYAAASAKRYPDIGFWTPINEPLITTLFSAKYGWWNECLTSDASFVRATLNVCEAVLLAMAAIRRRIPGAAFVHSESCEYTHAQCPDVLKEADFHNERRFLPLDLILGHSLAPRMEEYARDHGMTDADHRFFMDGKDRRGCLVGTDYYVLNEHVLHADGSTGPAGDVLGYYAIARQYHDRYQLPLIHTETNRLEKDGSTAWLEKQWLALLQLRRDGVPVHGFTWYSLTDQKDWDTALREDAHRVNSVGLYDLDRQLRPVGECYRQIVQRWRHALGGQPALAAAA